MRPTLGEVAARPSLLMCVGPLLLLVSCGQAMEDPVGQQRQIVEELIDSIDWPEGYEQVGEVRDFGPFPPPNPGPGIISFDFTFEAQDTAVTAKDFHEAIVAGGFVRFENAEPHCTTDGLQLDYYNADVTRGTNVTLSYSAEQQQSTLNFNLRIPTDSFIEVWSTITIVGVPNCPVGVGR